VQSSISSLAEWWRTASTSTVQLDRALKARLDAMKIHPRETYNDLLERLLEELSPEVKRAADRARRDIKAGKYKTHEQVKRELGL
jgi:predicted transcriptional regulator